MVKFSTAIKKQLPQLRKLSTFIHTHPELGFEEHQACRNQMELLQNAGFAVSMPSKELKTAFKAIAGRGGPVVCICSEYDALPELGHACGHNLIATAAVAAGIAVQNFLASEKIPGRIVVMGTPAEESFGGKIYLERDHAFEGIDCCLMAHPFDASGNDPGNLAVYRFDVKFTGKSAHAASEPEAGINALDAVNLLFAGINAWRQQLPEHARIHGIITSGGTVPNIIPDHAGVFFYVRAADNATCQQMILRFKDIVKGAALMTGCKFRITEPTLPYLANRNNAVLNNQLAEAMSGAGLNVVTLTRKVSTDFANISLICPSASIFFQITRAGEHIPLHSPEFQKAAGTDYAFEQALKAAQSIAGTALRYLTDAKFRRSVQDDFEK